MIADEYGGIEGVVTYRDILEDIAGSYPAMSPSLDPLIIPRSDGSQLIDGLLPIEELKQLFSLRDLPGEKQGRYQTVGGFVMSMFGSIPQAGQSFAWRHLCFEVVDMDGHRVDKVLITPFDADPECRD
jgi:putative hemolysin